MNTFTKFFTKKNLLQPNVYIPFATVVVVVAVVSGVALAHHNAKPVASKDVTAVSTEEKSSTVKSGSPAIDNQQSATSTNPTNTNSSTPQTNSSSNSTKATGRSSQPVTQPTQTTTGSGTGSTQQTNAGPTISFSADGCYVTGAGVPGSGYTIEIGAFNEGRGGSQTYSFPASGMVTQASGGGSGMYSFGRIYDANNNEITYAQSHLLTTDCPAGDPTN